MIEEFGEWEVSPQNLKWRKYNKTTKLKCIWLAKLYFADPNIIYLQFSPGLDKLAHLYVKLGFKLQFNCNTDFNKIKDYIDQALLKINNLSSFI